MIISADSKNRFIALVVMVLRNYLRFGFMTSFPYISYNIGVHATIVFSSSSGKSLKNCASFKTSRSIASRFSLRLRLPFQYRYGLVSVSALSIRHHSFSHTEAEEQFTESVHQSSSSHNCLFANRSHNVIIDSLGSPVVPVYTIY